MTMQEFIDVTDDIVKFYGKDINSYERNIWFEELGQMKADRYKKIVRQCFRSEKYMPKLADILRIKKELPADKDEWIPVKCDKCGSSGYITYYKKDNINNLNYFFACRCFCENGQRLSKKIPSIHEINLGE